VHLPFREVDAGAAGDRSFRIARPQKSRSLQDAEHFFVEVKMIGRAAGRDRADELCDLALDQLAVPAIAGVLHRLIAEVDFVKRRRPRRRRRYTDHCAIDLHLHSPRQQDASVFFQDIQDFVAIVADGRWALDGPHRDVLATKNLPGQ